MQCETLDRKIDCSWFLYFFILFSLLFILLSYFWYIDFHLSRVWKAHISMVAAKNIPQRNLQHFKDFSETHIDSKNSWKNSHKCIFLPLITINFFRIFGVIVCLKKIFEILQILLWYVLRGHHRYAFLQSIQCKIFFYKYQKNSAIISNENSSV